MSQRVTGRACCIRSPIGADWRGLSCSRRRGTACSLCQRSRPYTARIHSLGNRSSTSTSGWGPRPAPPRRCLATKDTAPFTVSAQLSRSWLPQRTRSRWSPYVCHASACRLVVCPCNGDGTNRRCNRWYSCCRGVHHITSCVNCPPLPHAACFSPRASKGALPAAEVGDKERHLLARTNDGFLPAIAVEVFDKDLLGAEAFTHSLVVGNKQQHTVGGLAHGLRQSIALHWLVRGRGHHGPERCRGRPWWPVLDQGRGSPLHG